MSKMMKRSVTISCGSLFFRPGSCQRNFR